jgi:hypothetical protein
VAETTDFPLVFATSFDARIDKNFFKKLLISFAFYHTQLAY